MKTLIDVVYLAGTYDMINLGASAALEAVVRRIYIIVDAYSNPSKPNWDNAKIYGGQEPGRLLRPPV